MVILASGSDIPLIVGVVPVCPLRSEKLPTVSGNERRAADPGPGVGVAKKNDPPASSQRHPAFSGHKRLRQARSVANTVEQVSPNWQSASVTQDFPQTSDRSGTGVGVNVTVGRKVDVARGGRGVLVGLGVFVGLGVGVDVGYGVYVGYGVAEGFTVGCKVADGLGVAVGAVQGP